MKILTCLIAFFIVALASAQTQRTPADSIRRDSMMRATQKSTGQDYQNMLDQLRITSTRPGPSGNPQAPNAANSDESKATPYTTLPEPLVLKNGKKVTSAKRWWSQRRPEIAEDFDREVYGRIPANTPKVNWEVTRTADTTIGSIKAMTKYLVGHVDNSAYPKIKVDIQLTLTTPANAKGPVPVITEFGFVFPPGFRMPPPPAGTAVVKNWQEQLLEKGWGCAVIVPTSFQADNGAGLTQGIIGLVNKGQPRKPDDWGTLKAWAWGASRAIDYYETDKAVDTKRLGIEGLSRYGKAAIASSGEYHWFAGNFIKYTGPLTPIDLPVDAHELVAMCAPRPVFISVGSPTVEGQWVDAKGMFLAGVHAGPVYKLLGKKDLGTTEFPPIETALVDGEVAFRQHSGGHTTGPNWETFIKYAGKYLK
jgi:hypothetical protein